MRLVTRDIFAKRENDLAIADGDAADAVLQGYSAMLESGGRPFVLEESHDELREMATGAERNPVKFWGKLVNLPSSLPPKRIQNLLDAWLPEGAAESLYYSLISFFFIKTELFAQNIFKREPCFFSFSLQIRFHLGPFFRPP